MTERTERTSTFTDPGTMVYLTEFIAELFMGDPFAKHARHLDLAVGNVPIFS